MRHFWNWLPVSYRGILTAFYSIFPAEFYQFSGIPSTVLPLHAHTHTSPHDRYVDFTDTPKICATILSWLGTKYIWVQKFFKKSTWFAILKIVLIKILVSCSFTPYGLVNINRTFRRIFSLMTQFKGLNNSRGNLFWFLVTWIRGQLSLLKSLQKILWKIIGICIESRFLLMAH